MANLAMQRDALMPRPPGGTGPGLMLALLIHGLLVLALAFGVRWRASEPEGVTAELWAAVPQIAAPKAVEPEPVPRPEPTPPAPKPAAKAEPEPDAQIAIEKQKREERERRKKEEELAEKRRQDEADKRKADEKRREQLAAAEREKQRQENLKRILGQAGASGPPTSTGTAARDAGPSASYAGRIKARIKPNIVFPDTVEGNPLATVLVKLAPDGTIVGKTLVKRSGVAAWDEAVIRAIEKTEVLPRDVDGRVPSSMEIDFRPRD